MQRQYKYQKIKKIFLRNYEIKNIDVIDGVDCKDLDLLKECSLINVITETSCYVYIDNLYIYGYIMDNNYYMRYKLIA